MGIMPACNDRKGMRMWKGQKCHLLIQRAHSLPSPCGCSFCSPQGHMLRVHVRTTGIWSTSLSASGPRCKLFMTAFSVHGWGQHWSTTGCYATRSVPSWSTGSSWSNFASDSASCQCTWEGSRWWFKLCAPPPPTSETRMDSLTPGFGMAQIWPVKPFAEWTNRCNLYPSSLSFPLVFSLFL